MLFVFSHFHNCKAKQGNKNKFHTATAAKSLQSCPTPCNPIEGSPPGSPIPGILQARILEWVAIPLSRDLSEPGIKLGSSALQADSLLSETLGKVYINCE